MRKILLYLLGLCLILTCLNSSALAAPESLNLRDFGATGDGITDDAPAFQKALDALAASGGGTLFIPAGKYVIATPVSRNFAGLASSITITGVESLTMPAPPTAGGHELAQGLDLPTEVYPRTGVQNVAISLSGLRNLVIKGWSQNATAAIALRNVGTGILDQLTCIADADHIFADADTRELTVINSTYAQLDSFAAKTTTIDTPTDEDDPVQYVRARFADALGREPDAAGHFYWSNLLIHCFSDALCTGAAKQALDDYLSTSPAPTFAISGRITDEKSAPLAGVTVTLSGSQSVTTMTDANGVYVFTNLPTSGEYSITASQHEYTFNSATATFNIPSGDQTANFTAQLTASLKKHSISGRVFTKSGAPMEGVLLTLSGSVSRTTTTTSDGSYSFTDIQDGSSCTVTTAKDGYVMSPLVQTFNNLVADTVADFQATKLPSLLTMTGSDRAVALELTQLVTGPFPLTTTLLSEGRNRTRIIIFGSDLGLLPGEDIEAITAEAEDVAHNRYSLRVEFVGQLSELPDVSQVVLRLNRELDDASEVLVSVTVRRLTSNKVRIAIQP